MGESMNKLSTRVLLAMVQKFEGGIHKHVVHWPGNAPGLERLRELLSHGQARQEELEAAQARLSEAQQAFNGPLFHAEVLEVCRLCRETVRALFKTSLLDFGVKPRAQPSRSSIEPPTPENFRVLERGETSVRLAWKPLAGRVRYEVLLSHGDPMPTGWIAVTSQAAKVLVEGLIPGEIYYLRVRAKRSNRTGSATGPLMVAMPRLSPTVS